MSATLTGPPPTMPAAVIDAVPEQSDHSPAEVAEEHRWLRLLVTPFVLGAAFFALVIGTGHLWLMAPAMILGPGLIIGMFVYLALSRDANAER
jgi:hypothetical protein